MIARAVLVLGALAAVFVPAAAPARQAGAVWYSGRGESDNYAGLVGSLSIAEAEKQAHKLGPSGYDPAPWIRRLTIPVLWLYAGRDRNQPTGTSMEILSGLSAGHDFTTALLPNAPHSLFDQRGFPPDLFATSGDWLKKHGLT